MKSSEVHGDLQEFRVILHAIQRFMARRYSDIRKTFQLSPHQFGLLYHIQVMGPTHLSGLQRFLPGHLSGIGQMVDRLVHGGWLERNPDPTDRRKLVVSLMPKAREALGAIEPFGMARIHEEIREMDRKGRRRALSSLREVASMMGVDISRNGVPTSGRGESMTGGGGMEGWPFQ
jgi:DNA-binding MarR family transcriptional regulator